MNHYSQRELDTKIHTFMTKKMKEFPELEQEQFFVEQNEPIEKRDAVSRNRAFPVLRLNTQY